MHWLVERMAGFGERGAVAHRGETHGYDRLVKRVAEHAATLERSGVHPHETVGLVGDYSFDAIAAFLALMQNRNVVVPIVGATDEAAEEMLAEAHAERVVRIHDRDEPIVAPRDPGAGHELLRKLQERGSAGLILFSSGSTGKPKAMIHDLDALVNVYRDRKARPLAILLFLMFDHIGGLNTLFNALAMGALVVIPERRDPDEVCELVERHEVGLLPCSPTFLNLVLLSGAHERHDLKSLRMITYGTESMPESLLARLRERFPRTRFLQTFGTSETGIARTASRSSDSLFFRIDDPNLEHRIVDGELWLKSDTQIVGYLNASMEAFTEDGWFRTGDLVETDAEGFLRIVGRRTDVINVGGRKVLPAEVESELLALPFVADCTVYAAPNAITGESVAADVVLRVDTDPATAKREIRRHCAARLEAFKVPSRIAFVERTAHGARFKKLRPRR